MQVLVKRVLSRAPQSQTALQRGEESRRQGNLLVEEFDQMPERDLIRDTSSSLWGNAERKWVIKISDSPSYAQIRRRSCDYNSIIPENEASVLCDCKKKKNFLSPSVDDSLWVYTSIIQLCPLFHKEYFAKLAVLHAHTPHCSCGLKHQLLARGTGPAEYRISISFGLLAD